jgi:hypothetical protein
VESRDRRGRDHPPARRSPGRSPGPAPPVRGGRHPVRSARRRRYRGAGGRDRDPVLRSSRTGAPAGRLDPARGRNRSRPPRREPGGHGLRARRRLERRRQRHVNRPGGSLRRPAHSPDRRHHGTLRPRPRGGPGRRGEGRPPREPDQHESRLPRGCATRGGHHQRRECEPIRPPRRAGADPPA